MSVNGTNFKNGINVGEHGSKKQIADSDGYIYHLGTKVTGATIASGAQAALISDPADGTTIDAEARTAINAIIDALQAFGIVASE